MTPYPILDQHKTLANLPGEWAEDLCPSRRERVMSGHQKVVVLDDDPTGTQTVHGLPDLTTWSLPALKQELVRPEPGVFILTNSRCMPPLGCPGPGR